MCLKTRKFKTYKIYDYNRLIAMSLGLTKLEKLTDFANGKTGLRMVFCQVFVGNV